MPSTFSSRAANMLLLLARLSCISWPFFTTCSHKVFGLDYTHAVCLRCESKLGQCNDMSELNSAHPKIKRMHYVCAGPEVP